MALPRHSRKPLRSTNVAHRTRRAPSILGHVYSLSTSPKSAFGEHADAFQRELTAALLEANPSGIFRERLESDVVIARRADR